MKIKSQYLYLKIVVIVKEITLYKHYLMKRDKIKIQSIFILSSLLYHFILIK
jgi:hypothetical protein